ncbi:MAG: hypothetical protein MI923_06450 [Phycisphaerales bacterium]|nr:hypothetical protein [Phycisphaerales bacterium]
MNFENSARPGRVHASRDLPVVLVEIPDLRSLRELVRNERINFAPISSV